MNEDRFKRNDFVRIGFGLIDHVRAIDAGAEAMCLWVWANFYSRKHLLDGWVPLSVLPRLLGYSPENVDKLFKEKLFVPLEFEGKPGIDIVHYVAWNQTRAEVEASRKKARVKKKGQRKGQGQGRSKMSPGDIDRDTSGDVLRDIGGSPEEPSNSNSPSSDPGLPFKTDPGSPLPDAKPPLARPLDVTGASFLAAAWAEGIAEAAGGRPHPPNGGELRQFAELVANETAGAADEDAQSFYRADGAAFGRWCKDRGALPSVMKYKDWLRLNRADSAFGIKGPAAMAPPPEHVPHRRAMSRAETAKHASDMAANLRAHGILVDVKTLSDPESVPGPERLAGGQ